MRPLNFALLEADVLLRVAGDGAVRAASGQPVAFEVDDPVSWDEASWAASR